MGVKGVTFAILAKNTPLKGAITRGMCRKERQSREGQSRGGQSRGGQGREGRFCFEKRLALGDGIGYDGEASWTDADDWKCVVRGME